MAMWQPIPAGIHNPFPQLTLRTERGRARDAAAETRGEISFPYRPVWMLQMPDS
jgi:hypothetical protein